MTSSHPGFPAASSVGRIVALMIGEIGDLIVTFPTLEALKARFPDAHLTLIARPAVRDLVAAQPAVDEFMPFSASGLPSKLGFMAHLALKRWDLWVDLHTPTYNTCCSNEHVFRRNALLMRAAGCRYRLGFGVAPMTPKLTHVVPAPDENTLQTENIADTTLRLADGAGDPRWRKAISISPALRDAMAERLGTDDADIPFIGLFFGGKQSANVWPETHIARFLPMALERLPGYRFVLFGGAHEAAFVARVLATLKPDHASRIMNLTHRLSLIETAAAMSLCRLVVSTDSGPMHIADAAGAPLVTLFGSHSYLPIWLPRTPRKRVINHRPPCSLCFASECPENRECMSAISPEEVMTEVQSLLEELGANG